MEISLYIKAFLVGGVICALSQIFLDKTKYTPGHLLSGLTVIGAILGAFGLYDKLIDFSGAGASMMIMSFGNSLVKGAITTAQESGAVGILTGMFSLSSSAMTAAIVFGFLVALVFKPDGEP